MDLGIGRPFTDDGFLEAGRGVVIRRLHFRAFGFTMRVIGVMFVPVMRVLWMVVLERRRAHAHQQRERQSGMGPKPHEPEYRTSPAGTATL